MAEEVNRVVRIAVISRFIVLLLQIVSSKLITNYDTSGSIGQHDSKLLDKAVEFFLQGFRNWDSIYYLNIAENGYQYEQYMAFFPLYPWLTRILSCPALFFLDKLISYSSVLLVVGWSISSICFITAAVTLYKLTQLIFKDDCIALYASVLFCINPASIFMSTVYTESIFVCCLFTGLYWLEKSSNTTYTLAASMAFALGSASRSNGIISCGFICHVLLKRLIGSLVTQLHPSIAFHPAIKSYGQILCIILSTVCKLIIFNVIIVSPFMTYQYHGYLLYCNYGNQVIIPPWCFKTIPLSYSYIQDHYWNVGFMRYFEAKQIPNFVLALPMVVLCVSAIVEYFQHSETISLVKTLGLWQNCNVAVKKKSHDSQISFKDQEMQTNFHLPGVFVYIVHLLFITVFAVLSIHVQVLTRMIASSSPVIYWYTAHLMAKHPHSINAKLVLGYFLTYFTIGVILHCNFYPWT